MMSFLMTKFGKILSSILFVVSAVAAIFYAGKREQKKTDEVKDLKDYKETKERIDETPVSTELDVALTRLRKFKQLR